MLARQIEYHDEGSIEMFREGADLIGQLHYAGNGWPVFGYAAEDEAVIDERRQSVNLALLERMREDAHSDALFEHAMDEAELGRASCPRPLTEIDLCSYSISPRFGVEQGYDCSRQYMPLRSVAQGIYHM